MPAALGVGAAHAADGDAGDVERVARGLLLRGLSDDMAGDDHEPGRGGRGRAQELPPAPARLGGRGDFCGLVHIHTFLIGEIWLAAKGEGRPGDSDGERERSISSWNRVSDAKRAYITKARRGSIWREKRRPGPSLGERPGRDEASAQNL
ncbi:MAG: hypothetical protein MZV64_34010 [Ignavibacteriales bacterium]|nr:hypothetical protein [Ignavibacteriales bacterium]